MGGSQIRAGGEDALALALALLWLAVIVLLPLAVLTEQARPFELREVELAALTRATSRGLGFSLVVATASVAVALLLARTVHPLALLALLLISPAIVARGVLALGLSPGPLAATLALILDVTPFAALLIWLRLRTRPAALIDAAADLGAGPAAPGRRVGGPHQPPPRPGPGGGGRRGRRGDVVAWELAGGGHSYTPGLLIRDALIREGAPDRALVAVLGLLILALPCARLIAGELASAERSDWRALPGPPRGLAFAGWLVMAATLAGPALVLLGDQPEGFGLADRQLGELALRSLWIAGVVAALASSAGLALAVASRGLRRQALLGVALLAPLAIPPGIFGLLMLELASTVGLAPGPALTVLALLGPGLALAFVAARLLCALIPASLIDCARDLGASAGERLRLVWLPLARPALLVAFVVSFAWVLGQAAIPSFTSGPGGDTLAVALTIHARAGEMALVRRWSLILVVVPVLAATLAALLTRRRPR